MQSNSVSRLHLREPSDYWLVRVSVLVAVLLYAKLPDALIFAEWTRWVLVVLEVVLLLLVLVSPTHQTSTQINHRRLLSIAVIALINLANALSLGLLIRDLLTKGIENGNLLISSSLQIWLTNIIVFGLWYWELDRGGPMARARRTGREPDFLFAQMSTPGAAPPGWMPTYVDYLYLAFTNAMAFSPADTLPLTPMAKLLMLIQALASLITIALVAARAVNILH